jgi:hypothetical protein
MMSDLKDEPRRTGPHGCHATAKTTGEPCKNNPGPGALVCHIHGGKAPQTRRAAARRAAEEQAWAECARLGVPVETTAADALQEELNVTFGAVRFFRARLAEWGEDALAWGDQMPGWWTVFSYEREHLVTVANVMLRADVQGRLADTAKETAGWFRVGLERILDRLGCTPEQRELLPGAVAETMAELERMLDPGDGDGPASDGN